MLVASISVAKRRFFQYADETQQLSSHLNYDETAKSLQNYLSRVINWSSFNLSEINANTTQTVCYRSPGKQLNSSIVLHTSRCISCKSTRLAFVNTVTYDGIEFDSDLSWNTCLTEHCMRSSSVLCCLFNITSLLPFPFRNLMVHWLAYVILKNGITLFRAMPWCLGF